MKRIKEDIEEDIEEGLQALAKEEGTMSWEARGYEGWKAIEIELTELPKGVRGWVSVLWGMDIFIQGIPLGKVLVLLNLVMWVIK